MLPSLMFAEVNPSASELEICALVIEFAATLAPGKLKLGASISTVTGTRVPL